MNEYEAFLERKSQVDLYAGFEPLWMPDFLFDFQKYLTDWAIRKGNGALFADCGLGKTPMQLVWAENVVRKTNRAVLVLAPLAVSYQTAREAEKFGIDCRRSNDGRPAPNITVTNYERLHYFNPDDFAGVVCDESSILKNYEGVTRSAITEFMKKMQYRLLTTATAAPNDYDELGTSSEALGELGYMDMLNRFFKNDQNNSATGRQWGDSVRWRFKGHAEIPFWKWVSSWARALRSPSDYKFENGSFALPVLEEVIHKVEPNEPPDGYLFNLPAIGPVDQRKEKRRTIQERCEIAASLVENTGKQAFMWANLNDEADALERLVKGSVQISGSDEDDEKEEKFLAFIKGEIRVLVTKPKIGAWGLNFQNCSHTTYFPTHSYEQYYQGIRRFWRFGQKNKVRNDIIMTEGEELIFKNLKRKADAADKMFSSLVTYMNDAIRIDKRTNYTKKEELPSWL